METDLGWTPGTGTLSASLLALFPKKGNMRESDMRIFA